MKKLLRIDIQDGENSYSDFSLINKNVDIGEIIESYDGFLRAVKNKEVKNITEEEIKILRKFGVI